MADLQMREAPIVQLRSAAVAYADPEGPRRALCGIDLDMAAGEWLAVVGPNGSGKSTLAGVLAGLRPLSRGTVARRHAAPAPVVFQNPEAGLTAETVYEEVCFSLENMALPPEEMPARCERALALVGLAVSPSAPVARLSGGQKQLLALAACLVAEPALLVLDEPTAMLDPAARERVLQAARCICAAGAAVVWVTQRLEELVCADRVLALSAGRIAFAGEPEAFFYGDDETAGDTPCERLGWRPPLAVEVARRLLQAGVPLAGRPLDEPGLREAVAHACRS